MVYLKCEADKFINHISAATEQNPEEFTSTMHTEDLSKFTTGFIRHFPAIYMEVSHFKSIIDTGFVKVKIGLNDKVFSLLDYKTQLLPSKELDTLLKSGPDSTLCTSKNRTPEATVTEEEKFEPVEP